MTIPSYKANFFSIKLNLSSFLMIIMLFPFWTDSFDWFTCFNLVNTHFFYHQMYKNYFYCFFCLHPYFHLNIAICLIFCSVLTIQFSSFNRFTKSIFLIDSFSPFESLTPSVILLNYLIFWWINIITIVCQLIICFKHKMISFNLLITLTLCFFCFFFFNYSLQYYPHMYQVHLSQLTIQFVLCHWFIH